MSRAKTAMEELRRKYGSPSVKDEDKQKRTPQTQATQPASGGEVKSRAKTAMEELRRKYESNPKAWTPTATTPQTTPTTTQKTEPSKTSTGPDLFASIRERDEQGQNKVASVLGGAWDYTKDIGNELGDRIGDFLFKDDYAKETERINEEAKRLYGSVVSADAPLSMKGDGGRSVFEDLTNSKTELDSIAQTLSQLEAEYRRNPSDDVAAQYNQLADSYNQTLAAYNEMYSKYEPQFTAYNDALNAYNEYLTQYGDRITGPVADEYSPYKDQLDALDSEITALRNRSAELNRLLNGLNRGAVYSGAGAFDQQRKKYTDELAAIEAQVAPLEARRAELVKEGGYLTGDDLMGSAGYALERLAAAGLGFVENVTDFAGTTMYGLAEGITSLPTLGKPNAVSEWFGKGYDTLAGDQLTQKYEESIRQRYKPTPVDEKGTAFGQTVAQVLLPIGAGKLIGGLSAAGALGPAGTLGAANAANTSAAATKALFGASAAGGATAEAHAAGASHAQSLAYGLSIGAMEIAIESVSGSIPGLPDGSKAANVVKKVFSDPRVHAVVSNPVVSRLIGGLGEGGEEALSAIFTPYIQRALYDRNAPLASVEEIGEQALLGGLASLCVSAGIEIPVYVAESIAARNRSAAEVVDAQTIQDIIETGLESPMDTNSYKLAAELKQKQDAGKDLTAREVLGLYQENVAQVNSENAAEQEIADPILEAAREAVGLEGSSASVSQRVVEDVPQADTQPTPDEKSLTEAYNAKQSVPYNAMAMESPERQRLTDIANGNNTIENQIAAAYNGNQNNMGTEGVTSEEVHLRNGGQRNGSAYTGGTVRRVAESAGGNQVRKAQGKPADSQAASLTYGKTVSTASFGIGGGSHEKTIRTIAGTDTKEMAAARQRAKDRGLRVVFFAGNNLDITQTVTGTDGKPANVHVSARAYISGDRVFVRVDHPRYTADQIMRHEVGHDQIKKGEIDPGTVRDRIEKKFGKEKAHQLSDMYADAYEGSGLTADAIWEEVICDSLGDMNIFSETKSEGDAWALLSATKEASADAKAEEGRGPPSDDGKMSRDFPPYNVSHSDSNEQATRWAHRHDVKDGDQRMFSHHGAWYRVESDSSADMGYRIIEQLTAKQVESYFKEAEENGHVVQGLSERTRRIGERNRARERSGGRKQAASAASAEQRGENRSVQRVGEQQVGERKTAGNRNGDLQSGRASVEGVNLSDATQKYLEKHAAAKRLEQLNKKRNKGKLTEAEKRERADIKEKYHFSRELDVEGNTLSEEQQEFFKDSKVRDENGKLKVMYHGSEDAGFHVFDPRFSDDGISLFFVDSNTVAKGYSGTHETYVPKTFKTTKELNKFLAEIGNDDYEVVRRGDKFTLYYDTDDEIVTADTLNEIYSEFLDYSGLGHGSANYKVYLNLKKPLVVDAQNNNWDELPGLDGNDARYEYIKLVGFGPMSDEVTIEYAMDDGSAPVTETVNLYKKFDDNLASRLENLSPGESVKNIPANPMTTRSYSEYAKKNGYDGVIFNNVIDSGLYASGKERFTPATVAIAFASNQVKSVDNLNPTDDPDIRFSMETPVEETKNLIALHNLTETKLTKALALGGFPMPSIAVTRTDIPHTNFGDITLVMNKSTVDPKASKKNTVYSADAWTPTFPKVEYDVDERIAHDLYDRAKKAERNIPEEYVGDIRRAAGSLESYLNTYESEEGVVERVKREYAFKALYLAEQGKRVENKVRENRTEKAKSGMLDAVLDVFDEDVETLRSMPQSELHDKYAEDIKRALVEYGRTEAAAEAMVAKNGGTFGFSKLMAKVLSYAREPDVTVETVTDTKAIEEDIDSRIDEEAYDKWLHNMFRGLIRDSGIYNGKDYYTPSGNRKGFKQTHYPATLDNIAKAMAAQNDGNSRNVSGFYGIKSLRAGTAERFKSIAHMHELEGRLKHLTQEEADAINDALGKRLSDITERIYNKKEHSKYSNSFMEYDSIGNILMEVTEQKQYTVDSVQKVFSRYQYNLGNQLAADIRDLLFDVTQMPVNIFEAKPERAVRFDEVLAVVLPDNADTSLRTQLEQAGLNVLTYKAGDDASRIETVNSVDGARFSRELETVEQWRKDYAKLEEVNEGLRDQFKTTEFAKVDRKSLDSFTKRLLKDYSSGADINETRDALDGLYTYLANGEDGMSPSWNEAYKRAYETAASILEASSALDDDMYRQYRDLRERLRNARISIAPEYGNDLMGYENLQDFRKRNMGRLNITKDGSTVDVVYSELAATYPELFDETEYTNQGDQLVHIADVLESMRPMEVNPYSYNMRESATWLANDIMERFFDLPQAKPTFADKARRKLTNQAIKDAKKLERVREQKNERIKQLIEDNREKVKQVQSKERDKRLKAVQEVKEHYKDKESKASESRKARDLRARVVRHAEQMSKKLLRGTDKSNVPEALKGAVAELLAAINMESNYTYDPATGGYRKSDDGLPTRRTEEFRKVREQYEAIAKNNEYGMVLDPNLLGVPTEGIPSMLDQVIAMKDIRLADMNLSQLQVVYDVLRVMEHSIQMAGKMLTRTRWESIHAAAENFIEDTATRRTKRALTKDHKMLDIETPYTFFSHFGNAGKDFFRMLRNAQDEEEVMQDQLRDRLAESVSLEDRQAAEKETVTYTTQRGDDLTLSKAHIMNIYLLNKRKQAQQHLLSGGIVQPEIGKVRKGTDAVLLNELDVANIISKLSDKEREMADALQKLTLLMAEWGNKSSMTVYGIKKFNDPDYWTIHSSDIGINQTVEQGQNKARSIANMGSAKAVIPEARNTLDIDSAFEVFDRHASDMMCYSAWLAPMEDANRLFNYKYRDADWNPTGKTMKGIIDRVSGEGSTKYWLRLMEDIQNGLSAPADTASEQGVMKAIGNVKKAAVSANLRVVIQQPTAYARAAVVLDPDIMLVALGKNAALKPAVDGWNKAVKYAPIAARKAAGGYEVAANPKQLAELLYQPKSKKGKVAKGWREAPLWLAGKMDQYTWGTIWNACEMQVARDNKALKKDSDAFNDAVKELFTDVIDQTQVVDGVLQRSQAMRSGSNFMKQMTSFTGEPTQGANMVIRAYDQLRYEQNPKKRGRAIKTLSRAVSAYMFVSVLNAFAQSLIDGLRDDDEDKEYWERVWTAFHGVNGNEETWWDFARNILLASNVVNNMNPATWLPVWKDVLSVIQGYSVERMDAASLSDFFASLTNVVKSVEGDGKYTPGYAALKSLTLGHKLLGGSSYNTLRDIESIVRTVQVETDNYLARYETMKLMTKPENNLSEYVGLLFKAYQNDQQAYKTMYDDLVASGVDPEKIRSKMESLLKDAQGVDSVYDLEQRYLSPTQQKEYSAALSSMKSSSVWKKASAAQRDDVEGMLYNLTVQNAAGEKLKEKIDGGARYGLDETEYLLYKLALDMCDQPSESGKLGSYTNDEVEAAIRMLGLSAKESAYLWDAQGKSEKSNPWRK